MGKLVRTIPVVVLVTTALMVVPSGAGAVTIGQTGPTTVTCIADNSWVQPTVTSGNSYVVPSAGAVTTWVVTSWSTDASGGGADSFTMKVFRKVGDPAVYMAVGHDGPRALTSGQLNTFTGIQVPVKTGDVLGLFVGTTAKCSTTVPGETMYGRLGDLADGASDSFIALTGFRLNISAQVEPDCDQDGLGDQTQDPDLSSCAPGTAPPPGTGPAPTLPSGALATCEGKPATIVGTNGSDVRTASQGPDVIAGLGGNDTLSGLAGNDVICGGAGKDTLKGGKGKDTLLGQKGKDALQGGGGKDLCKGGKGKDTASKCEVEKSI